MTERIKPMFSRRVMLATVTPLASIFGSGFLIIVPVLERTLGALAITGAVGICAFAWLIGTAVRHNVRTVEPLEDSGGLGRFNNGVERAADLVIVLVGVFRGFSGLHLMERVALGSVLVLTTVFGGALFFNALGELATSSINLAPVPDKGLLDVMLVLGGIVITVQGFETVRYLSDQYDRETRVLACRLSQLVSTSIYIGFILVATPFMGLGTGEGADQTLLDIAGRVVPLLTIPVVITAVLSQFSAGTADTVAADGNFQRLIDRWKGKSGPYVVIGSAAIMLVWVAPTLTIIALASRAFAAYYSLQCVLALRTSNSFPARLGFGLLAVILLLITIFARPAS